MTCLVSLYGGPDDGTTLDLGDSHLLPDVVNTEHGVYVRDHSLDVVRSNRVAVHRYRWRGPLEGSPA